MRVNDFNRAEIDVGFGHNPAIIDFLVKYIDSVAMRITVDELITVDYERSDADRNFGIAILRAALHRKPML